jgi:hypothetical protein
MSDALAKMTRMASSKTGRTTRTGRGKTSKTSAPKTPKRQTALIAVKRAGGLPRKAKAPSRSLVPPAAPIASPETDRTEEIALDVAHISAVLQAAAVEPEAAEPAVADVPRPDEVFVDTPPAELELVIEPEMLAPGVPEPLILDAELVASPTVADPEIEAAVAVLAIQSEAPIVEPAIEPAVVEPAVAESEIADAEILAEAPIARPVVAAELPPAPSGGWLLSKLRRWAGLRL